MTRFIGTIGIPLGLTLMLSCSEEGPAEKAGRQIDEAIENVRGAGEGTLERAGREVDEAIEEGREAIEEATE